ncbi:MepB family protein [Arenibacter sp. F20364]|uniref:MepB family protein n=1 Tax=Arenibacter sp. F20364 TaxID=2926415 RepID=UPI001FF4D75B|nr:MepB family protein [Arenibacter sp. F20364]MCK0188993.1 MepB family protein [Arenibacter sp. F20364]
MKITTNTDFTTLVIQEVYAPCGLIVSNHLLDRESREYQASSFELNNLKVKARKAKITPKKIGQFVTLWKRNKNGDTAPYEESDKVDLFVIDVLEASHMGQFIFPKEVLMEKGIVSCNKNEGKRGFRVYPPWSQPTNKTAENTQKWQLEYFLKIGQNSRTDLDKARMLYLLR